MGTARNRQQLLWPLAIAALIFFASSRPRLASPEISDIDKIAHFFAFGLLATLLCRLGQGWRAALWALAAASAFGATDEWHQTYVAGRAPDMFDWVADTLGAAVAVALYAGCAPYRRLLELRIGTKAEANRE
jgi:VanZ family protein